jgi:hypothetical protein
MAVMRLFNEPAGRQFLLSRGVAADFVQDLDLVAISGIANMLSAVKMAKYFEMDHNDVILTVATDSMEMYQSRLAELRQAHGELTEVDAASIHARHICGAGTDNMQELGYHDRKRIHNLKYYTWVEQQGKTHDEIQAQWFDHDYWTGLQGRYHEIDRLIDSFNQRVSQEN